MARKRAEYGTRPALRSKMPKHDPDFRMMLSGMHGFKEQTGEPLEVNLLALKEMLFEGIFDDVQPQNADWDEVLSSIYLKLAFFRKYYCGVDCSNEASTGGVYKSFLAVEDDGDDDIIPEFRAEFDKGVCTSAWKHLIKYAKLSAQQDNQTPDSEATK